MKVLFATILLTVSAFVATDGPNGEMKQLLCESKNPELVSKLKECWKLVLEEYLDIFRECKKKHSVGSDEELCKNWEKVQNCAHEEHGLKETDYKESSECALKLYNTWKHGQS